MSNNVGSLLVELGVNTAAFSNGLDKATYKAKESAKQIGNAFKGLGEDVSKLLGSFSELGGVLGESISSIGSTISTVSEKLGGIGGAAGAAAIGLTAVGAAAIAAGVGLAKMAESGAEEVLKVLIETSEKTGISAQALLGFQAAGATVGLSLDAMVTGFRKFDRALIQNRQGSTPVAEALNQLGVTATTNKAALLQVADAFSKMEDGPVKAAYAIQLFGRAGLNMIPILNKGSAGIREFDSVVATYGPTLDGNKESVEAYEIAQEKLSLSWDRLKVQASTALLPALSSITTFFANANHEVAIAVDYYTRLGHAIAASGLTAGIAITPISVAPTKEAIDKSEAQAKELQHAQELFELQKDMGTAGLALERAQQSIAGFEAQGTAEAYRKAAALEGQLPYLRKAAELEKQVFQYKVNPQPTALEGDKIQDLEKKTSIQIAQQRAISEATKSSTADLLLNNAAAQASVEIGQQNVTLNDQLVLATGQLARARAGLKTGQETQATHDAQARIDLVKKELTELQQDTPQIIAMQQELATGKAINAIAPKLDEANDATRGQIKNLEAMVSAQDNAAVRSIKVAEATEKEQLEYDKAKNSLAALIATRTADSRSLADDQDALDKANVSLKEANALASQKINDELALKLKNETIELQANASAWEATAAAVGMGTQAKINAEVIAARTKAAAVPGATDQEVNFAGRQAAQGGAQQAVGALKAKAAQMDLNQELENEIADLKIIEGSVSANSTTFLLAKAKEKEATIQFQQEWDKAALAVGTFDQQVAASFQELVLQGQDFWQKFLASGTTALDGVESALAKFVTTGKANFKQVGEQFEESFIKNGLQKLTSLGTSSILGSTGLGSLIPGIGGVKLDGSSESAAYWVRVAGQLAGGGANLPLPSNLLTSSNLGGALPALAGGFNPLSLLSLIPGLAGGGDVTPGKAYVVGENHPEFFVPSTPGTVHPSLKMSGTQQNVVNVNFHGVQDHDSFKRNQTQVMQQITNAVGRGNSRR